MSPRPNPNVSLRLASFAKADLDAVVKAIDDEGQACTQSDLVAVLVQRARQLIPEPGPREELADDVRAYRKRCRVAEGAGLEG